MTSLETPSMIGDVKSSYLAQTFLHHSAVVEQTRRALETVEFDAIAFRGVSGALIAPVVAHLMGKSLIAVRKGEANHSSFLVEGPWSPVKFVIVDDCRESGATVKRILEDIKEHLNTYNECVGVYFYTGVDNGPVTSPTRIIGPLDDLTKYVDHAKSRTDMCLTDRQTVTRELFTAMYEGSPKLAFTAETERRIAKTKRDMEDRMKVGSDFDTYVKSSFNIKGTQTGRIRSTNFAEQARRAAAMNCNNTLRELGLA